MGLHLSLGIGLHTTENRDLECLGHWGSRRALRCVGSHRDEKPEHKGTSIGPCKKHYSSKTEASVTMYVPVLDVPVLEEGVI